jgi:hypothetical protein
MIASGDGYTRAAARVGGNSRATPRRPSPAERDRVIAREFEVLGQVLHELQRGGHDIQDCWDWMDYWRKGWPGGGWVIEWMRGPYTDEMQTALAVAAADIGAGSWLPSDIGLDPEWRLTHSREQRRLLVGGVPFELRAIEPVGLEEAFTRRMRRDGMH